MDCAGSSCATNHQLLNCITTRRVSSTPSTQHTSTTSTMNPSSASFTPQLRSTTSATPTQGFLGHVLGQKDNPRFSPTTYVEISDANGVWHRFVAFFDSGSDTTLIKSSLARRLGLAGTRELFHYGVAGGGSKTENSTRYTLQTCDRCISAKASLDVVLSFYNRNIRRNIKYKNAETKYRLRCSLFSISLHNLE